MARDAVKKREYMKAYYEAHKDKFMDNSRTHRNRVKAKLIEAERIMQEYKKRAADVETF